MKPVPLITALITALVLAFVLGEGLYGYLAFAGAGLIGGWLAGSLRPGSEWVYWCVLIVTAGLLLAVTLGVGLSGLAVFCPVVLAVSYFVARVAGGFTGQLGAKPA